MMFACMGIRNAGSNPTFFMHQSKSFANLHTFLIEIFSNIGRYIYIYIYNSRYIFVVTNDKIWLSFLVDR